jgi:hypothetical protein
MNQLKSNFINFQQLAQLLINDPIIPLLQGGNYKFIQVSSTKINGVTFENSIHYRISDTNSKRVTFELIRAVYDLYLLNNVLPTRAEMMLLFPFELCSRPCNYSVAIVSRFIN